MTAEQEPPRGEGGVPLPVAKRREKGEGATAPQGDAPNFQKAAEQAMPVTAGLGVWAAEGLSLTAPVCV